jgi:catechol-2,3-dioxygenase
MPRFAFSHFGFFVHDLERMAGFYTRLLGLTVSDRGQLGSASLVFLTRDPRDHHQIVLVSGRPGERGFNPINQISFRAESLADLRELHRAIRATAEVTEIAPVSHGNALSVYFRDPEGNRVEVFIDTPWYVEQPVRIAMDLSLGDEALWAWAERTARALPGFRPAEEWRAELANRIGKP